jgi:hypothetical protein
MVADNGCEVWLDKVIVGDLNVNSTSTVIPNPKKGTIISCLIDTTALP